MWIVRLALSRPRTIAVLALLIVLLGVLSIDRPLWMSSLRSTPRLWTLFGATVVLRSRTNQPERGLTTTVSNIQHIESQSLTGISIIKIHFQPGTEIANAIAQIESSTQTSIRNMPPGITPPLVLQFQASDVPVVKLSMSSQTMAPAQIND